MCSVIFLVFFSMSIESFAHEIIDNGKINTGEDFMFKCPDKFFEQMEECVSFTSPCPSMSNFVSMNYDIVPKDVDTLLSEVFISNCSYPISLLFDTNNNNTVKLNLVFKNLKKPYKLWLHVASKYPVENLKEKIACWSKRSGKNTNNKVNLTEVITEEKEVKRFLLELDGDLKYYFCRFLSPGEIKPAISNKIIASSNAANIFQVSVRENSFCTLAVMDNNNLYYNDTVYFAAVDTTNMITGRALAFLRYFEENCHVNTVNSTLFCSDDAVQMNNKTYFYAQTVIDSTSISTPVCFNKDGVPLSRSCEAIGFLGAQWKDVNVSCYDITLSPATSLLENVNISVITANDLTNISQVLSNISEVNNVDLDLISNILHKSPTDVNDSKQVFQIVDNILKSTIQTSNTTDAKTKFLDSVENYVENLSKNTKNITILLPNIACSIKQPFLEITSNQDFKTKLNNVTVKLPNTFLNSLNLSETERNNFTISVVEYKDKDLFPSDKIINSVVDVVTNVDMYTFEEPLSIFLPSNNWNVTCVFWNVETKIWDKRGIKTGSTLNDGTIECKTNHLTRFSLLIISHEIIEEHKINIYVKIIWIFESIASFMGVVAILIMTLVKPKEWRVKRRKTIHLSIIITLEILILWIHDYFFELPQGIYCTMLGAALHYIVLVKYTLMFLIAKVEFQKYLSTLESVKRRNPCFSYSDVFTAWVIPAGIIAISLLLSKELYEVVAHICGPKGTLFIYFKLLPVTALLLINMFIYFIIMMKLACNKSKNCKHQQRQFLQAVLLWFLLGICWIFGILSNMMERGYLRTVFYYTHGFIAPLQGFVIFVFSVLLDKKNYKCF